MLHFGLIGKTLAHSLSKQYFEATHDGAQVDYNLIEIADLSKIRSLTIARQLSGFNVTIPYKQAIFPYLDAVSPEARSIGAVNVVKVVLHEGNGGSIQLEGYNTDAPAFLETLQAFCYQQERPLPSAALILGTGGAAVAVAWALHHAGVDYRLVSRTPEAARRRLSEQAALLSRQYAAQQPDQRFLPADHIIDYNQAYSESTSRLLIVNATPVGTTPNTDTSPWKPTELLTAQHLCYDLIYNPTESRFLHEAKLAGADTLNGLAMLQRQAQLSYEIWGI